MAFTPEQFAQLRPFLFHFSARKNRIPLQQTGIIEPAASLLRRADRADLLRQRRRGIEQLTVEGTQIALKDQSPLIFANAALSGGWTPEDFVAHLNAHVYFWPGKEIGPVKHGARMRERYSHLKQLELRIPTMALFDANPSALPLFCEFNSGAPRMQNGKKVPRGPNVFSTAASFPRKASEVVEVVFRNEVRLPAETEEYFKGKWRPFGHVST